MSTRIYVGRLPYDCRERDLERFFKGYGKIREILLKNGFGFVEFDDFKDADDAVYELNGKELLGERITVEHAKGTPRGSDLRLGGRVSDRTYDRDRGGRDHDRGGGGDRRRPFRSPPRGKSRSPRRGNERYGIPTRTEHRLTVENLSTRVSWQDLKDMMRDAGEVTYADAHRQKSNEGVVDFATSSGMKAAIEKFDGKEINGRKIKLVEDKRAKRRRSTSRSRSRSRSRRRSATRSRTRSRSRSVKKSRSRSRSKTRSKSKGKSASRSRSKSAEPTNGATNGDAD